MKKFIAGAVFGAILASTITAYGATTLVGKQIQGETDVIVNGTKLDTAIIVDGKSYAPLRSVGTSAGYEVGFTADKKITLDTPVVEGAIGGAEVAVQTELDQVNADIERVKNEGKKLNGPITQLMIKIYNNPDDAELKAQYDALVEQQKQLAAELEALEKKKAELEAQQ